MRLRHKPWADDLIKDHPQYVKTDPENYRGQWQNTFQRQQAIHLEIGSGKGQFITQMAASHPEINYIAMEVQTSALVAILEKQIANPLDNLQIVLANAEDLALFFEPGEIDLLYLNFSDPWPKKKHAKRRLTSPKFLANYQKVLPEAGEIHFKTDNQGLFEYSLASMSQYGMYFKEVWLDLHASDYSGNIQTEYEEKFSKRGQRIYRLEAAFRPA